MGPQPHLVESRRFRFGGWLHDRLDALFLAPARRELERARRAADTELIHAPTPPPRLAWRGAELVAGARRLELADELRRLSEAGDTRSLPLPTLAASLSDLGRPVSPRGVLMLERLLGEGAGPLYRRPEALAAALAEATRALELPS